MRHPSVSFLVCMLSEQIAQQRHAHNIRKYNTKHIEQQVHYIAGAVCGKLALQILHKPAEESRNKKHCNESLYTLYSAMAPEELKPDYGAQPCIHDKMRKFVHMCKKRQGNIVRRIEEAQINDGT